MSCNVDNRTIFCKDNLDVLRGINSKSVDLVYLDPPFNKKKEFTAPIGSSAEGASFSDVFKEEDVKEEWIKTIEEDNEELRKFLLSVQDWDNTYNFAYLAYMAIRVLEIRRILKETGSIYLHCDPTMSHYLKLLLDCVFGEKNFVNEVVWYYRGTTNSKRMYARKHDLLLFYSKSQGYRFNCDEIRIPYEAETTYKRDSEGKLYKYWSRKIGNYYPPQQQVDGVWTLLGKYCYDVFDNIPSMATAHGKEYVGYPTQKPLALIERIIKASSNKDEIVLDPFCGCATTCVAAEKLERKWVGIDVSIKAYELVQKRLKQGLEEQHTKMYAPEVHLSTSPPKRTDIGATYVEQKYVYVISNSAYPGEYKVGIAKDWKARLNSYQTSDPNRGYKLEYELLTPHFRAIEQHIHEAFDSKHEWVQADLQEIKDFIEDSLQSVDKG